MPQKVKSSTTSSNLSSFNKTLNSSHTEIQYLKGVGPKLGTVFASRDIKTVRDLLYFFPRAYEDRSKMATAKDCVEGQGATFSLSVTGSSKIRTRTGKTILDVRCRDAQDGVVHLKYFHVPRGLDEKFKPGAVLIATGTVKIYQGHPEMVHPEIVWNRGAVQTTSKLPTPVIQANKATLPVSSPLSRSSPPSGLELEEHQDFGRIVPIYSELDGIPTKTLRKLLWVAVQNYAPEMRDDIPQYLAKRHSLPSLSESIKEIHFPSDVTASQEQLLSFQTHWHQRLIYEEFLKFQLMILKQRLNMRKNDVAPLGAHGTAALYDLQKSLPFTLTKDQQETLNQIVDDLKQSHPMNRLVQGDVGSGKTAVALLAAGAVMAEGHQAVLMSPTEILAEQHLQSALKLFSGKIRPLLLTGSTPQSERKKLFKRLAEGEPLLLIGTHALLEDPVQFKDLQLVMIDEQHRFGVDQRRILRSKGCRQDTAKNKSFAPHVLILTATPIPRTLALTAYGDLNVSSIKTMPPGRAPIITKVIEDSKIKLKAFEHIREELRKGRQAYFIYPLVNESESEGFTELKAATVQAALLQNEIFPEFKVGLLHGKLKADEKNKMMADFKTGLVHILVSTTVVEVGVDVANSTIMAIEHAERFGLSQLHQLRGRVGRGSAQSYCYLFTHPKTQESTEHRLGVLEDTTDGFKVSEADLEIRGPGEFLGTRQAGALPFQLGNIVRDRDLLLKARNDAIEILKEDADLSMEENKRLKIYFETDGAKQFEWFKTG